MTPKVVALDDDADGRPRTARLDAARARRCRSRSRRASRRSARKPGDEYRRLLYVAHDAGPRPARSSAARSSSGAPTGERLARPGHARRSSRSARRDEAEDGTLLDARVARRSRPRRMKTVPQLPTLPFGPRRPDWLEKPAPPPPPALRRVSPSAALAGRRARFPRDRSLGSIGESALALERGRLIHRLLQSLPDIAPAERRDHRRTLPRRDRARMARSRPRCASRRGARRCSQDPAFAPVFAPAAGPRWRSPASCRWAPPASRVGPDRPPGGCRRAGADRRLQDQPAGAEPAGRRAAGLCAAARALSGASPAALS